MEPLSYFDFGWALRYLKEGRKVAREGWNGKGMYIVLVEPTCDYAADSCEVFKDITVACDKSDYPRYVPTDSYIVMCTAQGTAQPGWLASQADMLADDWLVLE